MTLSVLVVDDDENIRELMDVTLMQAGFKVCTANDGEAALDLLKRLRFDVVVLDVHMPKMSGLDVLRRISGRPRMPPVLMVTANTAGETVREAVKLGCCGYLAKPFTPQVLIERVKKAAEPQGVVYL